MSQARISGVLGFTTERDDAGVKLGGNTGNLIAKRKGTTGALPVFFNAHIDTVQPTPNIQVIQEDGVIRTDGSTILGADDKAGVACILKAIESLNEDGVPTGDTEVIITIAEEIGLKGAREFDPNRISARSGWVVDSGQPLNSIIVDAPRRTRSTRSSPAAPRTPGRGPRPASAPLPSRRKPSPPCRSGASTTRRPPTSASSPAARPPTSSPQPASCRADPHSDIGKLERQTQAITDALKSAADEAGATVEVTVERAFTSFTVTEDAREVQVVQEAMRSLGMAPQLQSTGGGMDANFFNQKGMKCAVVGCGYQEIHTTAENIAVSDMATGARVVEAIMKVAARG